MAQSISLEQVKAGLKSATDELLKRDAYLLRRDVNERSITHKLASYLQAHFPHWNVDCEYNRNHDQVKQLRFPKGECRPDDTNAKTVFPDIIVHQRGSDENLLVIEVKKSTNRDDASYDCEKLNAFQNELGYTYAAFIMLRTGNDRPGVEAIKYKTRVSD